MMITFMEILEFNVSLKKNNNILQVSSVAYIRFLLLCQNGLTHILFWVSPLMNFKKRLFSNELKEVIANNGTNKGASETKLCSNVGEAHFFIPMFFSRISP